MAEGNHKKMIQSHDRKRDQLPAEKKSSTNRSQSLNVQSRSKVVSHSNLMNFCFVKFVLVIPSQSNTEDRAHAVRSLQGTANINF